MVIAFFDSGIGGLTVLKNAIRELPNHDYIYYADTKNAPYGVKTKEQVRKHVFEAVDFIAKHDIQALVIACNTATAVAINELRQNCQFHIVGMEPALKPAIIRNRGKNILVLATSLTLRAGKLEALIASADKNKKTVKMEMDALVGFAESWDFNSGHVEKYIQNKLRELRVAEFETIVLGCTHFIYYKNIIREIVGDDIAIIDGNMGTVAHLKKVLSGLGAQDEAPRGTPRGSLLRPDLTESRDYEGRVFAKPSEAKDTIHPCGKPQGFLAKEGDKNGGHILFYSSGVRDDKNREIKLRELMGRT